MMGMGEKPRNIYKNKETKEKSPVWLPSHPSAYDQQSSGKVLSTGLRELRKHKKWRDGGRDVPAVFGNVDGASLAELMSSRKITTNFDRILPKSSKIDNMSILMFQIDDPVLFRVYRAGKQKWETYNETWKYQ